ncbi:AfsR/SARP family transcriptional regulator [Nocardia sp. NPDC003345]
MRIEVLGPLRVVADDRSVHVGGARSRALLIRLALEAGRVVSARTLTESVWPEDIPDHPDAALHSLVARLRRALPDPSILLARAAGYLLDVPADAVDALCFERLAEEGRRALGAGRHDVVDELLTEALALWRGEPLTDIAHLPFAAAAAARLDDLRVTTTEDRIEAKLAGVSPERALLSMELNQLIAANPLRERLRGLFIRALIASGRETEALAAYEDHRRVLAEQLGTDPGPDLRELHMRILRGATEWPHAGGNLRAPLTSFVGREADRRQVRRRLLDNRLMTLVGPGGVGKTRLATATGTGLDIPVWLAELAPLTYPDEVPRAVVAALGLRDRRMRPLAWSKRSHAVRPQSSSMVANMSSMRQRSWQQSCSAVALGSEYWQPAANRSASPARCCFRWHRWNRVPHRNCSPIGRVPCIPNSRPAPTSNEYVAAWTAYRWP